MAAKQRLEQIEVDTDRRLRLLTTALLDGDGAYDTPVETILKQIDEARRLERRLRDRENALKEGRPDADATARFEDALRQYLRVLDELIGDIESLLPDVEEDTFTKLLEGIEDLLRGALGLGLSFEALIKRFKPTPAALVDSFDRILSTLYQLLHDFEALVKRYLVRPKGLIQSFSNLVDGYESLLSSREDIAKQAPTEDGFEAFAAHLDRCALLLLSLGQLCAPNHVYFNGDVITEAEEYQYLSLFEARLHQFEELLESLEGIAATLATPEAVARFEDVLDSLAGLLLGFASSMEGTPDPGHVASLENLLEVFIELLASFHFLVRGVAPAPARAASYESLLKDFAQIALLVVRLVQKKRGALPALVPSLEDILDGFADRLDEFADLVEMHPTRPLLTSFEELLRQFEELLAALAPIVQAAATPRRVAIFEDLLKRLEALLGRFADLINEHVPLIWRYFESLEDLLRGFRKLIKAIQTAKGKLPFVPPALQKSDQALLASLQALIKKRYSGTAKRRGSPGEQEQRVILLLETQRLLLGLAALHRRVRRPDAAIRTEFGRLVRRQKRLGADAANDLRRARNISPFVRHALDDLEALQARLHRTVPLRQGTAG